MKEIIITDTTIYYDEVEINKDAFEAWCEDNKYRRWDFDHMNHNGVVKTVSGEMTWDEYYDSENFKVDIAEFLKVRNPQNGRLRSLPDLNRSLKPILEQVKKERIV